MILPFSTQLKCVTTCPRSVPKGFNQASYYIPTSPYPPVHPPGNPKATRRPPTWPAVAFSAFVPQSLKQKNPKCPKTADTEKSPDHHQHSWAIHSYLDQKYRISYFVSRISYFVSYFAYRIWWIARQGRAGLNGQGGPPGA